MVELFLSELKKASVGWQGASTAAACCPGRLGWSQGCQPCSFVPARDAGWRVRPAGEQGGQAGRGHKQAGPSPACPPARPPAGLRLRHRPAELHHRRPQSPQLPTWGPHQAAAGGYPGARYPRGEQGGGQTRWHLRWAGVGEAGWVRLHPWTSLGWQFGSTGGRSGLFPADVVQPAAAPDSSFSTEQRSGRGHKGQLQRREWDRASEVRKTGEAEARPH